MNCAKEKIVIPVYTSITQEGSLSQQQRKEIAEAVTKIHVDATGAPRSFVNVRFFTYPAGNNFRGGAEFATAYLGGTIRAGRDLATKQKMLQELVAMMQRIGKLPADEVAVFVEDISADQVIEKGAILPQPGQEKEWLKTHAA
jgi:phenylpyruvate tautomerase PptA (4-oxalocrotonate tautomerase family)